MRVVYWGTYDKGKPRNRIMINGLRANGVDVVECHREIWGGVEDKSQISGWGSKVKFFVRWLFAYPLLIFKYLRLPCHDRVLVGYMGQLDVLILWPFAKIRGVPIVWDAFLSLYNTIIEDRKLVSCHNPLAYLIYSWEWLACRCASLVLVDTNAHCRYFVSTFGLVHGKARRVMVGAEPEFFCKDVDRHNSLTLPGNEFIVLFYGQYIPLHGIEYIVKAAELTAHESIRWVLIGKGQERSKINAMVEQTRADNITFIDWVPYDELHSWLNSAHVCLGVFGDTAKAKMVIPNKVFQILAVGRPLITGDTDAIRELLSENDQGVKLVPVADSESLAKAVLELFYNHESITDEALYGNIQRKITIEAIGREARLLLEV